MRSSLVAMSIKSIRITLKSTRQTNHIHFNSYVKYVRFIEYVRLVDNKFARKLCICIENRSYFIAVHANASLVHSTLNLTNCSRLPVGSIRFSLTVATGCCSHT